MYPTYAMGGGYVLGGEVARVVVDMHERMSLKFTPIEDATLGFWLSALDLRVVDHPMFWTWAAPCCFRSPLRRAGRRIITRFVMEPKFEKSVCSTQDPWVILHKIDSPTRMRFVGAKAKNCSGQFDGLSYALGPWLPPPAHERWAEKFAPRLEWSEKRRQARGADAGDAEADREVETEEWEDYLKAEEESAAAIDKGGVVVKEDQAAAVKEDQAAAVDTAR